ncbi:hypothetical protein GOP47_0015499 [Adiantum capillus-veneris]|uniref:SOSEKI DIX-like domain-containing protein n=1 Tax=Adiantum capillus-veneris TaxID=13818 RepID=A0A9D4UKY4_ADICA|nr:hypothetical protein GOP47_0015499 [Adiantum capillus-veneris]
MDQKPIHSSQTYSSTTPPTAVALPKKVQVVYFLSYRGGLLEQPHLMEISLSSSRGLCLRDVKVRLASLRGVTPSSFSWSYKRSYKEGFVWQDLESDNDLIFPTHNGSEYVIKGCRTESSCTMEQIPPSAQNEHGISTQVQPASRLAELAAPTSTAVQFANGINIDHANNKIMVESPSNAYSHRHDDNIPFNLGVIEGLEHLHLAKAIDVNYDYAESQASTPLNYSSHIAKQHTENLGLSKKLSTSKLHQLKGPIIERKPYDSTEFSVIKQVNPSLNPCPNVGADVTTQTGEDDDTVHIADEYGKGKLPCLPDFYQTDNFPCLKSRDGSFFKQKVSLRSTLIELRREEISPPPCSTSSSSMTTTSAHSASSSSVVSSSVAQLQKLNSDKLSHVLAEDQKLQEAEILLSSRVYSDKEAPLNEEQAMATSKSPLDRNSQGRETPTSLSAEFSENISADAVDGHICKNQSKSALRSSKVKPYATSLCSSSGRFLHLVSCGRGLEVIKPVNTRHIQRTPSMRYIHGEMVCEEASGGQQSNSLNATSQENSFLDVSPLNVNLEGESAANLDACPPFSANHGPCKMLCNGEDNLVALSPQDGNSRSKRLWHLRGWVHSHYKKKRDPKSNSISMTSPVDENAYTCLDFFEKHIASTSTDGSNEDYSSSRRRLIRVGSADYSSGTHQRSSSYGSNPNAHFINEWMATPLQGPQIGSRESINVGGESNQLAWRRRS